MPFVDWTFYTVNSPVLNLLSTPAPPVGTRWLHIGMVSGSSMYAIGIPKNPPYPHADITRGRLRTLIRHVDTSLRSQSGLLCMCSQENMLPTQGGAGYGAALYYADSGATRNIKLVRFSNGILDLVSAVGTLATSPNLIWASNVTLALELSWYLELPTLSGILLSVRMGSAVDFSDLAPVPNLTDVLVTSSVLTSGPTMGFYAANWNSNNLNVYLDQTGLETL